MRSTSLHRQRRLDPGGDGPYYTQPGVVYQVTGSDPYRLDGNNNGLGCE